MADLTTYDGLKETMADWLMRGDLEVQIPGFIALAEAGFNRTLRHPDMIARADAVLDNRYLTLPGDFLEVRNLYLSSESPNQRQEFLPVERLSADQTKFLTQGMPRYYSIQGRVLEALPSPDGAYTLEMIYYAAVPRLSEDRQDNWLLSRYPDVYLYSALMHSAPYLKEDERTGVWAQLKEQAVEELNLQGQRAQYSGGSLRMRARAI